MTPWRFLKLHPKATSPPDLRTYKGFLTVVASTAQGRIDPTPTVDTIDNFRRQFETAWERNGDHKFPENVTTTIKEVIPFSFLLSSHILNLMLILSCFAQWIRTELKEMIPLSTGEMSVDALSPMHLITTMIHVWCHDYYEYRGDCPERSRVQLSFAILLYCFTSARAGEVHESTCRKKSAIAATACYKVSIGS